MSNILTQTNSYGRTNQYQVITTQDLLNKFTSKGYNVESITQTATRKKEKQGFQKHMIRLSHENLEMRTNVGDSRPELVLVNSYDGSTSLQMSLGIFRLICSNGLVVGDTFQTERIRHQGDVMPRIDESIDKITEVLPLVASKVSKWSNIELTPEEKITLAKDSVKSFLDKPLNYTYNQNGFNVRQVLATRHWQDRNKNDLWTVYNAIQENVMRHGFHYYTTDKDGHCVRKKQQAIRSIVKNVDVNKKLWNVADSFAA